MTAQTVPIASNFKMNNLSLEQGFLPSDDRIDKNKRVKGLDEIRFFLLNKLGLCFDWDRQRSLERVLNKRMEMLGITSYSDYLKKLSSDSVADDELSKLTDILTIGETSFFRYEAHDKALLESVLPEIISRKQQDKCLKIWSAGCATGEEAYSLALIIRKHFPCTTEWNIQIMATDINKKFLQHAKTGLFHERTMRSVSQNFRDNFFTVIDDGKYLLKDSVRKMISFEHLNLHSGKLPDEINPFVRFDIILCRNVLIYFNVQTRKKTLERLVDNLHPQGCMFFGHTEMMQNISDRLRPVRYDCGFYYKLQTSDLP